MTNSVALLLGSQILVALISTMMSLRNQWMNPMLVFMIRGLFIKLKFLYAQYPCRSLTAETMYGM